ncbi:MAG: glycoside hydrolase family 25 protein [Candidatus Symbiodolus clandestinus]
MSDIIYIVNNAISLVKRIGGGIMPNSSNHSDILNGIDVSRWQGEIDWQAGANSSRVEFVIVKATEGATWQDPKFQANWQAIKHQGIPIVGAYHFFRSTSTPADQANNILNRLKQVNFNPKEDLVAIDVENRGIGTLTPSEVADSVRQLIGNLSEPVISSKVLIYTSPNWWNSHVQDIGYGLSQQPLWVAHWTTAKEPRLPNGWNDWKIWQYTNQGTIPGIQGLVDLNRMQTKSLIDREASELPPSNDALEATTTKSVVTSAAPRNNGVLSYLKSLHNTLKNLGTYLINGQQNIAAKIAQNQIMNDQPSWVVVGQQLMKEAFILQQESLIQSLALEPETLAGSQHAVGSLDTTSYMNQSTAVLALN